MRIELPEEPGDFVEFEKIPAPSKPIKIRITLLPIDAGCSDKYCIHYCNHGYMVEASEDFIEWLCLHEKWKCIRIDKKSKKWVCTPTK